MKLNKPLEKELNKQFPKGDKARGRALVLNAVANIELEKQKNKILEIVDKRIKAVRKIQKQLDEESEFNLIMDGTVERDLEEADAIINNLLGVKEKIKDV